jgi:hypothetical protein
MQNENTGQSFELNPDLARLAAQQSAAAQGIQDTSVPTTSFVGSLNNQTGNVAIVTGTVPAGITATFTGGAGSVTFDMSGFGSIVTHNQSAAVVNSAIVAGVAYVQADFQAVIDKLNELLGALRTAGIIHP